MTATEDHWEHLSILDAQLHQDLLIALATKESSRRPTETELQIRALDSLELILYKIRVPQDLEEFHLTPSGFLTAGCGDYAKYLKIKINFTYYQPSSFIFLGFGMLRLGNASGLCRDIIDTLWWAPSKYLFLKMFQLFTRFI